MSASGRLPRRAILAPIVVSVVMVFFFVWLFAAALHKPLAHDLPVGVVAPAMVAETISTAVEANAPGTFSLMSYASAEDARTAVLERDIAGALVIGSGQPLILVASAGGEAAAKTISAAFAAMAEGFGQSATVEDVQPLPASDTRGLVPFFLVLGVSVSAFIFQLLREQAGALSFGRGALAMVAFALLDGLLAALAVGIVLGFDSGYWSLAGTCALLALAVASATATFCALFGRAGIGLAGLVIILLGNASSGSVVGSAFLPQPFRWLSPGLPAGSGLEATRSVLYFGGSGVDWKVGTLAIWVAASFAILACVAAVRFQGRSVTGART